VFSIFQDGTGAGELHGAVTGELIVNSITNGVELAPTIKQIYSQQRPGQRPVFRGMTMARGSAGAEERRNGDYAFDHSLGLARLSNKDAGSVLIAGGSGLRGIEQSAEVYDSSMGAFVLTGSMTSARVYHAATRLSDGQALLAGGNADFDATGFLSTAEIYDSRLGTFHPINNMLVQRQAPMATLLTSGEVMLAGGYGPTTLGWTSAELYEPLAGVFVLTGNMTDPHSSGTATLLESGAVLVGCGSNPKSPGAEIYDPSAGCFKAIGDPVNRRNQHTATLLKSGRVLFAGGQWSGTYFTTAELYDPATGAFIASSDMTVMRVFHTATLLDNGKVLLAGGQKLVSLPHGAVQSIHLATAELYDPGTDTFAPTGDMSTGRYGHTATLLMNGEVLIAGGSTMNGYTDSAELYDPQTGKFGLTGNLHCARFNHTATFLGSR